jgi:glyoxylase-like metal-dependent hydrolase (beta-lactamase superfamily II)
MNTLAPGISYIDVNFLGVPGIIATAVLHGPGGVALIDPGPTSTLPALRAALAQAGIGLTDVRSIVLTHIHLDHAGATGTIVHEHADVRVYVHEKGAPHMIDPGKLLASATRLWGADMDRLWGEVRPVPTEVVASLAGGERIDAAGRDLTVAYTPGHASHHVSFYNADSGVAFVGDTAGICLGRGGFVLPPTPPPDIDPEAWRASLALIDGWGADTLFITHFGAHAPAHAHLTEMADHITLLANLVRASLARPGDDESREAWFTDEIRRELRRRLPEDNARAYEVAGRFDLNWKGLARYWRKRAG